jgi:ribonuclease HII
MLKVRYLEDTLPEIGVDEAGRGPLWGPMMAAAVLWPAEHLWTKAHRELYPSIKDSKKISAKKREKVAEQIKTLAIGYGIGIVSAEEIDILGATRANQMVFRRSLTSLYDINTIDGFAKRRILIDGILPLNDCSSEEVCVTVTDGDALLLSIAAASILAKVSHDAWVLDWCATHVADAAKYDLLSCKGYGTAKHRQGILDHGYTDLHRRLYLRKLIPDIVVSRGIRIIEEEE